MTSTRPCCVCGLIILMASLGASNLNLKDVSGSVHLAGVNGYVAAVADMDNNHFADIMVINKQVCTVLVWKSGQFKRMSEITRPAIIHSVLPADFNGDGKVDLLLCSEKSATASSDAAPLYSLTVHWGGTLGEQPLELGDVAALPALIDINVDLLPDVLVSSSASVQVHCASASGTFSTNCSDLLPAHARSRLRRMPSVLLEHSTGTSVIASLTHDSDTGKLSLSTWRAVTAGSWTAISPSPLTLVERHVAAVGTETWQDINVDGTLDLLVPVCWDKHCSNSSIVIYYMAPGQSFTGVGMTNATIDLHDPVSNDSSLHLDMTRTLPYTSTVFPAAVRCADMDLDGFVDAFVIGIHTDGLRRVLYLHNEPMGATRTLSLSEVGGNITPVSFSVFDLEGNGSPDLLISQDNNGVNFSVTALAQQHTTENAFVKIVVESCVTTNSCIATPGTALLGSGVVYQTAQHSLNDVLESSIPLLSQIGTMSLQMPSVIMGVGRPITYIRSLEVALASPADKQLSHRWPAIIPNSKVQIVANPPSQPDRWEARLLLNAGHAVWQTALVFTAICVVLAAAFVFLRRQEMKEDELEKREQSRQFHFDAL